MRTTAILLILTALLSWVFQHLGWRVPVFKAYTVLDDPSTPAFQFLQWGTFLRLIAVALGAWLLFRPVGPPNPLNHKRWQRFKSIRRGYLSLIILLALSALALLDNLIIGKQALAVQYQGNGLSPSSSPNPFPAPSLASPTPQKQTTAS